MATTTTRGKIQSITIFAVTGDVSGQHAIKLQIDKSGSGTGDPELVVVYSDIDADSLPFLTRLQLLRDALAKDLWIIVKEDRGVLNDVMISTEDTRNITHIDDIPSPR